MLLEHPVATILTETHGMNVKTGPTTGRVVAPRQNLFDMERSALHELVELVEWRAKTETDTQAALTNTVSTAERELARSRKLNSSGKERDLTTLTESHQQTMQQIEDRYRNEGTAADNELTDSRKTVTSECDDADSKARTAHQDARWTADSVFEAAEKQSTDDREQVR